MKIGDLVRYKEFPHEALHKSGMLGLVLSEPYEDSYCKETPRQIDIWWNRLSPFDPKGSECFSWEYTEEIEVVQCASSIR